MPAHRGDGRGPRTRGCEPPDQARDLANHFQGLTRIEDEGVIAAENMLLTFTNIKSNVFPQTTQAVLDMATAMNNGAVPSIAVLLRYMSDTGTVSPSAAGAITRLVT